MSEKTHKLAAIVFTDIVGYTKRMEENEQKTMQLLQTQRDIVFPLVKSYGGEVIKEIGDGLMMMFDSAVQAVRFAISVQTRLKDEELTIRAGIHIGDVIFSEGDVFGSAVNTAARIEPLASPNGICISEDVRTQLHNKNDIITVSMGKKELKGVKEPVEIYEIFIEGVSEKKIRSVGFIFKDLWNRRVIQILLGYVASAWIIKQAVAALVAKYMLSTYLTELAWIVLLSLIPTVFLLAYFHGRRSSGKWNRIEIFGMPANVLLSIILVVILFNDKDLGASTTMITFENDQGKTETRAIPKNEYRKKLAIFFFENKTGDPTLDWLQYGMASLLEYDLSQDLYMEANAADAYILKMRDAGYQDGLGTPVMLKKEIAGYYHKEYFTTGIFDLKDNLWHVVLEVYDTERGNKVQTIALEHSDIFSLIDQLTLDLKKAVNMTDAQIKSADDLDVANIFTKSLAAFQHYTESQLAVLLNNNFDKSQVLAEKAISEDGDFIVAQIKLAELYFNSNKPDKAKQLLSSIIGKLYNLPERKQFAAKFFYYILDEKPDKAIAVVKMWSELYPNDISAHELLAERYLMANKIDASIHQYKIIANIAPEEYQYIQTLGDLYERAGKYDSSLYYYNIYADKYPNEFLSYKNLGDTYLKSGKFKEAEENYEKSLLIDQGNTKAIARLVDLKLRTGNPQIALELLNTGFENCKTPYDSLDIIDSYMNFYEYHGMASKSFEYFLMKKPIWESVVPPLRVMVFQAFFINEYVKGGQPEEGLRILDRIKSELQPPLDKVAAFGYLFYYIELKKPEIAEQYITEATEIIEAFGEQTLLQNIYYAQGQIAELKGNYEEAIKAYLAYDKFIPGTANASRYLASCYLQSGELKKAQEYLEEALRLYPNNPKTLYEAALFHRAKGNHETALEYCQKANDIWKNADESYEPAQKGRNLMIELSGV